MPDVVNDTVWILLIVPLALHWLQSKGEVVEEGPHTKLIQMEGFYKTLVEKQLASAEEVQ